MKLLCLLVVIGCAGTYAQKFWGDCGSTGMTINDVTIPGCTTVPCPIIKGKNASIIVNFTPSKSHYNAIAKPDTISFFHYRLLFTYFNSGSKVQQNIISMQ